MRETEVRRDSVDAGYAVPTRVAQHGATALPAATRIPLPAAATPPADPALAQLATVEPPALRAMVERLLRLGAITEPEVFEAGGYRLMAALDNNLAELSRRLGFRYEIRADELGRVVRRVG